MNNQTLAVLFETLDFDNDGFLSRSDLNKSAKRLGWSWHEAPLLAVFDLLSISGPIPKSEFFAFINQIQNDPMGPYGNILLQSSHFLQHQPLSSDQISSNKTARVDFADDIQTDGVAIPSGFGSLIAPLEKTAGKKAALNYQSLLQTLEIARISKKNTAMLIIDPQRSFIEGSWMQSIGHGGEMDVIPIRSAFDNCSAFLARYYGSMEIMFTRCPFPADSYGWADPISNILDPGQLYFIKPGNSVLFPHTNGFKQWVSRCLNHGKNTLIMCGCTLNSCVRVSAIETSIEFRSKNLQVVVDLSLSGARTRNYISSPTFNGVSAVESAVDQMLDEGVRVVRQIEWR